METTAYRTADPSAGESTKNWRVLVVENNLEDRDTLVTGLRRTGHLVDVAGTGGEALQRSGEADMILLDLELPDRDGLEVCRAIRAASDVPMIAVTSWGSELDRVLGLQAGTDDYVVKPYGFRELLARMDAVMRRTRPSHTPSPVLSLGELHIDANLRRVSVAGRSVEVTRKEFDLLHLLASHPDAVISRKQIMQQIWGNSWSRRTVDTHISSLRNKLGASDWIVTVRGVGFRFGRG